MNLTVILLLFMFVYNIHYSKTLMRVFDIDGGGRRAKESLKIKFAQKNQWTPPSPMLKQFNNYLKMMDANYSDYFRHPEGITGFAPPPWASFPNRSRIADYCFLPPKPGDCNIPRLTVKEIRYAYNPYTDMCVQLIYSGCNGNANNFFFKEDCEESCRKTPQACCYEPTTQSTTRGLNKYGEIYGVQRRQHRKNSKII